MDFVTALNDFIYGRILTVLLLGTGLYFTLRMRIVQVRHFLYMFEVLAGSRKTAGRHVSSFQALATSLAARVGTGNLAGVAIAITVGGPGAIFWMWVVAFLGMATSFIESTLAQVYKVNGPFGSYRGGPAYYMARGLGQRWMGILFSFALLMPFGLFFNGVQANTIAQAFEGSFGMPPALTGGLVVLLSGVVIFGGVWTIARVAEIVVPIMAAMYLVVALAVVVMNLVSVPAVIALIVRSALGLHQVVGGGLGFTMQQALTNGVRRGLFSNEAGMGSAPNAAATAEPQPPHPASQGYVQMLGVFIDTLVICSCTAAIILVSGVFDPASGVTGIQLTQDALSSQVGAWGSPFVSLAVFLFAFTSIVANYSYAETNLLFLKPSKPLLQGFRVAVLGIVMFGSVANLPLVWALADVSMSLMALLNITAILALSGIALAVAADFNRQLEAGARPTFRIASVPRLAEVTERGIWEAE